MFTPSHFPTFPGVPDETPGLPFGPHPCNPFALVVSPKLGLRQHWSFFLLCLFYSIFNEHVCFNALTCFKEAFYFSTSINLSTSLSCGLLRFYVGFLFYSNVVLNEPLCFSDLLLLQTTFLPFCSMNLFDSMDNDILCFEVLIIQ
jgi:hypothetical protein